MSKYTCNICGEFQTDHAGAMNLHKRACKVKAYDGMQDEQPETCDHTFRLLNPRQPNEFQAMEEGYSEVCEKCLELQ